MVTFINSNIKRDDVANIKSTHISTHLQSNNASELKKIYDFYASSQQLLVFTGFGGTGKRLIISHSLGFLDSNVIRLEYDCKNATVCDDILLNFISVLQNTPSIKKIAIPKIENFAKTFNRYVNATNSPIVVFINSIDNIQEQNIKLVLDFLFSILNHKHIKLIITGKTFESELIPQNYDFVKLISKPFAKPIFAEYVHSKHSEITDNQIENLYKITRGYYFYLKLLLSSLLSSKTTLDVFLDKYKKSGKIFDKYLCDFTVSTLSIPIRNFFWFLLLLRHGISYDALSEFDLYDENSIKFLLQNGYVYETAGVIYVDDYFHSDVEIIIPKNIKQKLHKYIIEMYKSQLHESPEKRALKISRQSINAEIEYHQKCADADSEQVNLVKVQAVERPVVVEEEKKQVNEKQLSEEELLVEAGNYYNNFKYTESIETYNKALNLISNIRKKIEIFITLAKIYAKISEWLKSLHYYNLAKEFYENNNEPINVNYIKYDIADVYYNTYNVKEARRQLRDVIYSSDSPSTLMIDACLRLGNIEDASGNYEDAFGYYKQGIDSIDDTINKQTIQELYFRYAVALDEANQNENAIMYYKKYLQTSAEEFRSPVLCNLGTMYEEQGDIKTAVKYFVTAYDFDLSKNNYDGIYYTSMHLANLYFTKEPKKAFQYIKMAINSSEMLNDLFYIAEAHLLAGDYYYRMNENENALKEFLMVYSSVKDDFSKENMKKITDRIRDLELRMSAEKFSEIMKNYA